MFVDATKSPACNAIGHSHSASRSRAFTPVCARFVQADPLGYDDGMNMYGYVKGDPINNIDPTGTTCVSWREGGGSSGSWDDGGTVQLGRLRTVCWDDGAGRGGGEGRGWQFGDPGGGGGGGGEECRAPMTCAADPAPRKAPPPPPKKQDPRCNNMVYVGEAAIDFGERLSDAGLLTIGIGGLVAIAGAGPVGVGIAITGGGITGIGGLISLGGAFTKYAGGGGSHEFAIRFTTQQVGSKIGGSIGKRVVTNAMNRAGIAATGGKDRICR
jgi:hypothetical protein